MSPALATFAWVGGIWLVIAIGAVWVSHRNRQRAPLPQRTPADVWADAAAHRAARDLDLMRAIWPDPPSARVIEAQYRHDTAKQRKENGQ
jgi:hypothetical protein